TGADGDEIEGASLDRALVEGLPAHGDRRTRREVRGEGDHAERTTRGSCDGRTCECADRHRAPEWRGPVAEIDERVDRSAEAVRDRADNEGRADRGEQSPPWTRCRDES